MKFLTAFLIIVVAIFFSCKKVHRKSEVEAAMQKFDYFLQTMNSEEISKMFTDDGEFVEVGKGKDSIKKIFLSRFVSDKMILFKSYTKSIEIIGDSAVQRGMFFLSGARSKDTSGVKGGYTVNWKRIRRLGWRIRKIEMKPI